MHDLAPELPSDCIIRPAQAIDKWAIQKLVWELIRTEAWEFDLRVLGFRLLLGLGSTLMLALQIWLLMISPDFLRGLLLVIIAYTAWWIISYLWSSAVYFVLIFTHALSNWSKYWVIEYNKHIVACAALNIYSTHSELYYLFVKPAWRRQGLGSYLVKHCYQKSLLPLYLICKPNRLQFYLRLGFVQVPWHELVLPIKSSFAIFRPHPKLWGFPLFIMQYHKNNPIDSVE